MASHSRLDTLGKVLALTLSTSLFVAGAWAATYAFTSNTVSPYGRKLTVSTKGSPPVPCVSSAAAVKWTDGTSGASSIGVSIGLAPSTMVWVSVDSKDGSSACGASSSEHCVGAAYYDLTTNTVGRVLDPDPKPAANLPVPDAIGQGDPSGTMTVLFANKAAQTWTQYDDGAAVADTDAANEPSQLSPVDTTWAVATDAGRLGCKNGLGMVRLLEWGAAGPANVDTAVEPPGDKFKPEGLYVRDIEPDGASCDYTAVAYVADYCGASGANGRVFAYGITTAGDLVKTDQLAMPAGCHPSTATYHDPSDKVYVLCQSAETIVPVTLSSPCEFASVGAPVELRYVPEEAAAPSCSSTPEPVSCADDTGVSCTPHDFAWLGTPNFMREWLLVTLDGANQIIAVDTNDLENQQGFHGKLQTGSPGLSTAYAPLEVELVHY